MPRRRGGVSLPVSARPRAVGGSRVGISPDRCRGIAVSPSLLLSPPHPLSPAPRRLLPEPRAAPRRSRTPAPRAWAELTLLPAPGRGCGRATFPLSPLPALLGRRPEPPALPLPGSASLLPHGEHTQSPAPAPITRPAQTNKQKPAPSQSQPDGKLSNDLFFQVLKRQGTPGWGVAVASISRPGRERGPRLLPLGVRPPSPGTGQGRGSVCGGCVCRNREGGRGRGELKKQHS